MTPIGLAPQFGFARRRQAHHELASFGQRLPSLAGQGTGVSDLSGMPGSLGSFGAPGLGSLGAMRRGPRPHPRIGPSFVWDVKEPSLIIVIWGGRVLKIVGGPRSVSTGAEADRIG